MYQFNGWSITAHGLNADQLQSLCNIHSKAAEITVCTIIIKCLCVMKIPVIFVFIPLLGMACIFYDDTFLHGIKEIFYAKFTCVILAEIVSRQHNMITDKDIYLMHVSTSSV